MMRNPGNMIIPQSQRAWLSILLFFGVAPLVRGDATVRLAQHEQRFRSTAQQIWQYAELAWREDRSAALLRDALRESGFRIDDNLAGIPTAFSASWGNGAPVIAVLGEYDALPGLSQQATLERSPRPEATTGHGCGHNLLGAGSAWAAVAIKEEMEARGLKGAIRFYGTPAEESGGGKVYMARAGAFDDVDIVLAWHPADHNGATMETSLANIGARFRFKGKAAHAALNPEQGRSALDAVILMTHAVELLREHIPASARVHYIIANGGSAANVVPETSELRITARHHDPKVLDDIFARIVKCAEAGALAAGVEYEMEVASGYWNILPNRPLAQLYTRTLQQLGAAAIKPIEGSDGSVGNYSTDLGDLSWIKPTAQLSAATYPAGTPAHSWRAVAASGMDVGFDGMTLAAKAIALAAIELFERPSLVDDARRDFEQRRGPLVWKPRLAEGAQPPLHVRGKSK